MHKKGAPLCAAQRERVLVTGGTGFVASWCIATLLARGHVVRASVRSDTAESIVREALRRAPDASDDWQDRIEFVQADLGAEAGWNDATFECDYVLHIAYPPAENVAGQGQDLVNEAIGGVIRVLRAALKSGVKRVVMTSSTYAALPANSAASANEVVWTHPEKPGRDVYSLSKLYAERAAWDFMEEEVRRGGSRMELVTLLPAHVVGPILHTQSLRAVALIHGLMQGRPRFLPSLSLQLSDVRDLAEAHIAAMITPGAGDKRFIVAGDQIALRDIARNLRSALGAKASKVPTADLPDFALPLAAALNADLSALDKKFASNPHFSRALAEDVLGYRPRPATDTVVDCANSLIAHEIV